MTKVKYNFSAGPAVLPDSVLRQIQQDVMDWKGTGISIISLNHRSQAFTDLAAKLHQDTRDIMQVPDNYKILWMQGGATMQFSAIPMNLLNGKTEADYVTTGNWSDEAILEGRRYCKVNIIGEGVEAAMAKKWKTSPNAAYVHYTINETSTGIELFHVPDTNDVPLVGDACSMLFARPLEISKFGLIYAAAQKNFGVAGLSCVIVRDDLIGHAMKETPKLLDYKLEADSKSIYNTPPTFAWYVASLILDWVNEQGGIHKVAELNRKKAYLLYDVIDQDDFYQNNIPDFCRSHMNITFQLPSQELLTMFLQEAEALGMSGLPGYRRYGGIRASLYSAMPLEGAQALADLMRSFRKHHG